jgi:hypothetical protein
VYIRQYVNSIPLAPDERDYCASRRGSAI